MCSLVADARMNQINISSSNRLIKNSVSNRQNANSNFNMNNISDRNKELSSPKFIKRNNSQTYKTTAKHNITKSPQIIIDKINNNISVSSKKNLDKNLSIEKMTNSSSKLRVNSAKINSISATKSNVNIVARSINLKQGDKIVQKEIKIKRSVVDDAKMKNKIKNVNYSVAK